MIHSSAPELRHLDSDDFGNLAQSILLQGMSLRFRAEGSSMRPWIRNGDILEVIPTSGAHLRRGEVILFRTPEGCLLAHRILRKKRIGPSVHLLVQGDSVGRPDGEIPVDWVMGKVVQVEHHGRRRRFGTGHNPVLVGVWCLLLPVWRWMLSKQRALKLHLVSLILLACLAAALAAPAGSAQAVWPQSSASDAVTLLSADDQHILLELSTSFPGYGQQGSCGEVTLPGWGSFSAPGEPPLPVKGVLLGIPADSQPDIQVVSAEAEEIALPASLCLNPPQPQTATSSKQEASDEAPVSAGETAWLRSQRVFQFRFQPFQYRPGSSALSFYRRITVQVSLNAPVGAAHSQEPADPLAEDLLRANLLNYAQARAWRVPAAAGAALASIHANPPASSADAYKIQVDRDGLYALTGADLAQAGLPVASIDPRKLHLFHLGSEVAIAMQGQEDGKLDPQDRLIFYGEQNRTEYTDTNVYWLTWDGSNGLRMPAAPVAPAGAPERATFRFTQHEEKNAYYRPGLPSGPDGDRWYWDALSRQTTLVQRDYTFQLAHVAPNGAPARVRGLFKGYQANPKHHTRVYLNGTLVDDSYFAPSDSYQFDDAVPASLLKEGDNTLRVELPLDPTISLDTLFLNWFEIEYDRAETATGDALLFGNDQPGTWRYSLEGFTTATIDLYDISNPAAPQRLTGAVVQGAAGAYTLAFQRTTVTPSRFAAAAPDGYLAPLSITRDKPSHLHNQSSGADYIMIAPADFTAALGPLADHYRTQGLRVQVVDVQDIYDEFSGGIFNPRAIHDFLAYAYASWPAPAPVYVLLGGDGNFDYKDYLGTHEPNYVPTFLENVDPWMGQTADDNYYVSVSGGDALPDMSLGRLPVHSAEELAGVVSKILAYAQAPTGGAWNRPGWNTHVLFVADNPETDLNFPSDSDVVANALIPAPYQVSKVYLGQTGDLAASQSAILAAINSGQLLVNFVGHASTLEWARENLFGSTSLAQLTNAGREPFFTSMDCFEGYYIIPPLGGYDNSSLAERLVKMPSGGAIATFSPTGEGLSKDHLLLDQGIYRAIFRDGFTRLGDITTQAKLFLADNGGMESELLDTYLLFGDPALKLKVYQPQIPLFLPLIKR